MYLDYYNLVEKPFSTNPDTRFIYLTSEHKTAIAKTRYAVQEKLGLSVVYGDVGTGKTTISRLLYTQFKQDNFMVTLLTNPIAPSQNQFLRLICREFGLPTAKSTIDLMQIIQEFLLEQFRKDKIVVLMIDEAQTLKAFNLELIRQILNFEAETAKLIQVVLLGQEELRGKISRKRSLRNRITILSTLDPLSLQDTINLIRFRMQVAGKDDTLFTAKAYEALYRHSSGVPRTICILCNNCLLRGFLQERPGIDEDIVSQVAEEMGY
jgi:general secretion pathway protein A